MAYNINITNGAGSESILNGNYSVTTSVTGYDNSSILPSSVSVVEGTNEYNFTIAATGTLTLHVTEEGTSSGTAITSGSFVRTDSTGTVEYGNPITIGTDGNAVFNYVPWAASDAPTIYYKQTASDGSHSFDDTVKSINLITQTETIEVQNAIPAVRTINYTDANYSGLGITGQITLN